MSNPSTLEGAGLDEAACRAVGLEPTTEWMQQVQYRDRSSSGWYKCGGLPRVSTDPAASHALCKAALEKWGLWPVALVCGAEKGGWIGLLDADQHYLESDVLLVAGQQGSWGHDPFVAIARAVAAHGGRP